METEATYNGLTYDQAADKKQRAQMKISDLKEEIEELEEQIIDMAFVMAKCKRIEEDATFRLGGEL